MMQVIKRYEKAFGARNYQFTAGKVDFIAIDAQTLDGNITMYSLLGALFVVSINIQKFGDFNSYCLEIKLTFLVSVSKCNIHFLNNCSRIYLPGLFLSLISISPIHLYLFMDM